MSDNENIDAEWARVKDLPSLHRHYGSQKLYQSWRYKFMRRGLISKSTRRFTKGKSGQDELRKDYLKSYGKKWRAKNQDKVRKSLYEYWRRRLAREEAGVENL
jgi:hypothetical protein